MATIYTDIYNRTKENITVLRKPGTPEDGITPQLVKLVNINNEYAGKFTGEAYFTTGSFQNAVIDKALLQNSTLSNVQMDSTQTLLVLRLKRYLQEMMNLKRSLMKRQLLALLAALRSTLTC